MATGRAPAHGELPAYGTHEAPVVGLQLEPTSNLHPEGVDGVAGVGAHHDASEEPRQHDAGAEEEEEEEEEEVVVVAEPAWLGLRSRLAIGGIEAIVLTVARRSFVHGNVVVFFVAGAAHVLFADFVVHHHGAMAHVQEGHAGLRLAAWVGGAGGALILLAAALASGGLQANGIRNLAMRGLDGRVAVLVLAGAAVLMAHQAGHHGVELLHDDMAHAQEGLRVDAWAYRAWVGVGGGAFVVLVAAIVHGLLQSYDLGDIVAHSTRGVEARILLLIVAGAGLILADHRIHVEGAGFRHLLVFAAGAGAELLCVRRDALRGDLIVVDSSSPRGFFVVALAATAASLVIARGVPIEENPGAFLHVLASAAANRAALRHPFDAHLGPVAWARGGVHLAALLVAAAVAARTALLLARPAEIFRNAALYIHMLPDILLTILAAFAVLVAIDLL